MSAYSQNGWKAKDTSLLATYTVPGTSFRMTFRKGDASVVLLDFVAWFHASIEPLVKDQCGSYNPRSIIGARVLSNHASGTATDLNWGSHVMGKRGTFTAAQQARIRARIALYGGALRWGGDYHSRADDMHFEINAGPATVKAAADKIRQGTLAPKPAQVPTKPVAKPTPTKTRPTPSTIRKGAHSALVGQLQAFLNRTFRSYSHLVVDNAFGPKSVAVVRTFQARAGIPVTGVVDTRTWAALRRYGLAV